MKEILDKKMACKKMFYEIEQSIYEIDVDEDDPFVLPTLIGILRLANASVEAYFDRLINEEK